MWKQSVCSQPEWHGGWNGAWKIWGRCIKTRAGNSHFEGLTPATKARRRWETSLAPVSCSPVLVPLLQLRQDHHPRATTLTLNNHHSWWSDTAKTFWSSGNQDDRAEGRGGASVWADLPLLPAQTPGWQTAEEQRCCWGSSEYFGTD